MGRNRGGLVLDDGRLDANGYGKVLGMLAVYVGFGYVKMHLFYVSFL